MQNLYPWPHPIEALLLVLLVALEAAATLARILLLPSIGLRPTTARQSKRPLGRGLEIWELIGDH